MDLKRFLAASAVAVCLLPLSASAAITLSSSQKQQVSNLALQLVGILTALSAAQQQGSAYLSSPAFQTQSGVWSQQVTQIAAQLVSVLSSTQTSTQANIPTMGGSTNTCPNLTRDLAIGAQGSDVAELQLFLAYDKYGKYLSGVNGYFDQETQLAVQRYQAGYGIVLGGSPSTTGFGRVGPGTRASIGAVCSRAYVISVPTITVPTTGPTGVPSTPPPPPAITYATGQLTLVPNSLGTSGGPTSVQFSVNMLPNSACSAASFMLSYGDGQTEKFASNASCGNQIKVFTHVYPQTGQYTATLTSGSFATTLVVQVQEANNSLSLKVSPDATASLVGNITATYDPGVTCAPGSYTLSFGDGQSQALTFNANGCIPQTQILSHTFNTPATTPYLITATDSSGHAITASFIPIVHN